MLDKAQLNAGPFLFMLNTLITFLLKADLIERIMQFLKYLFGF